MQALLPAYKSVVLIEGAPHGVRCEHLDFEIPTLATDMVDESATDALTVPRGMDKECPNLVTEHRDETHHPPPTLPHCCLGAWHVELSDISPLLGKELIAEKGMRDGRSGSPSIKDVFEVIWRVDADHFVSALGPSSREDVG